MDKLRFHLGKRQRHSFLIDPRATVRKSQSFLQRRKRQKKSYLDDGFRENVFSPMERERPEFTYKGTFPKETTEDSFEFPFKSVHKKIFPPSTLSETHLPSIGDVEQRKIQRESRESLLLFRKNSQLYTKTTPRVPILNLGESEEEPTFTETYEEFFKNFEEEARKLHKEPVEKGSEVLESLEESLLEEKHVPKKKKRKKKVDKFIRNYLHDDVADPSKEFFELKENHLRPYDRVFRSYGADSEVLVSNFNVELNRGHLKCLRNREWLNDEVLNFYFKLLEDRQVRKKNLPKCFFHNTFFYFKLVHQRGYSYRSVARWTRKVDLLSYDKVIIPIHHGNHWACSVINKNKRRYEYYDSIFSRGKGRTVLKNLRKYYEDEAKAKKNQTLDTSDWEFYIPENCPQQMNGFDCGMFAAKCANFISQDFDLTYGQKNMKYFRKRMCWELVNSFVP